MALLQRNIARSGRTVTVVKHSATPAGLSHRGRDKSLDEKFVAKGAFTEFKRAAIDGEFTKSTDQTLLIDGRAPGIPDLTKYNEVQDGNVLWEIMRVTTYRSADKIELYKIQVRR